MKEPNQPANRAEGPCGPLAQAQFGQVTAEDARTLLELMPDAAIVSDREGRITFVNQVAEALFGYPRDGLLGQPIEMLLPERFQRVHELHRAEYASNPHPRRMGAHPQLFGRRRDGSEFPVEVSLRPLKVAGDPQVISAVRDITERKQTEQALRDAEQEAAARARELEAIFEAMADAVMVYDRAGRILRMNGAAHAMLGTGRHPEALDLPLPQRIAAYTPRDEHNQPLPVDQWPAPRVLRGEMLTGQDAMDLHLRALDGREIQASATGAPLRDTAGQLVGAVCILRDVTEHRHLEGRTRDALRALMSVAESLVRLPSEADRVDDTTPAAVPIGRHLASLAHSVLGCSFVSIGRVAPETELLQPLATVGLTREQERRWHASIEGVPLAERLRDSRLLAQLHAGKSLILDLTRPPLDELPTIGSTRSRLVVPVMLGEQLVGVLVINDEHLERLSQPHELALARAIAHFAAIALEWERLLKEQHERVGAEARLRLLHAVLRELPGAVYLMRGSDARLVLANHGGVDVWGAPWPEGVGIAAFYESIGTHFVDREGLSIPMAQWPSLRAAQHGEEVRQWQAVIRHRDGTSLPVLMNAIPLDPLLLGEELGGLEPLVLTVCQDVTPIKEAERLKDEFVAMAAHELRNPMTTIRATVQMLDRRARREDPRERWQSTLDMLLHATDRLTNLTDDLLDITRLQAGRLMMRRERRDLVAVVRAIMERQQVTTDRHTITLETSADHLPVEIDPQRMEQVLINLINNAIKYSPDGGEITLTLHERRAAGLVKLAIRDHGIGIPAAAQARMFGRFERAENARARQIQGTGLGLYLCRELVERHGGQIWFKSTEGQGTTFFVTLPLADE